MDEIEECCFEQMPDDVPCSQPRDHWSHIGAPSMDVKDPWLHDYLPWEESWAGQSFLEGVTG